MTEHLAFVEVPAASKTFLGQKLYLISIFLQVCFLLQATLAVMVHWLDKYRISSYSFRGNYSFLNLEIVEN